MTTDEPKEITSAAEEDPFDAFWRSHAMCREISDAAIDLMAALGPFWGSPVADVRVENFRKAMRVAYEHAFPDKAKARKSRTTTLKVVN